MMNQFKKVNTTFWFWVFACVHVCVWTVAPSAARFNLPLDAMEGTTWGHHLALGYDKNPFMNAWLTEIAVKLGGRHDFMVYLFSQLAVLVCFWSIWRLARKLLPPVSALLSVMLLELIPSYNLDSIDFNDNVLELSFWALLTLSFYNAVKKQRLRDWLLAAFFAACAMMTKYYLVVLLISMFVFLVFNQEARQSFKKPGMYVCIGVFILLLIPHIIWLFNHDFLTVNYAVRRTSELEGFWPRFMIPFKFLVPRLEALVLPIFVTGVFFFSKKTDTFLSARERLCVFDWQFLLFLGFGPLIVTLLISTISGSRLHPGWGSCLMSLWGVILIAALRPQVTLRSFRWFLAIVFSLMFLAASIYTYSLMKAGRSSSANFPGRQISKMLTQTWHKRYHTRLAYVIGPRFEAGSVAYYSKDRPFVLIDCNQKVSFWIDPKDLEKKGAIFIWTSTAKWTAPSQCNLYKKMLKDKQIQTFYWERDKGGLPIMVDVGFIPPGKK